MGRARLIYIFGTALTPHFHYYHKPLVEAALVFKGIYTVLVTY